MLTKLDKYFEEVICAISLTVVACSVFLQVIMRFVFSSASVWAEETAVYGMIYAIYFGASMAIRERAHIRITMLVKILPRPLQVTCIVLADALWFAFKENFQCLIWGNVKPNTASLMTGTAN